MHEGFVCWRNPGMTIFFRISVFFVLDIVSAWDYVLVIGTTDASCFDPHKRPSRKRVGTPGLMETPLLSAHNNFPSFPAAQSRAAAIRGKHHMTPTLIPIAYAKAELMNAGTFTLFHAWDIGDLFTIEYWRGIDSNGACLRTLRDGRMVSVTHYATPGAAIRTLRVGGYPIPGVPAMTDDEREHAAPYMLRTLQAGHVTNATA
jgi:hypothetical protein